MKAEVVVGQKMAYKVPSNNMKLSIIVQLRERWWGQIHRCKVTQYNSLLHE